jgi:hypothetical protein
MEGTQPITNITPFHWVVFIQFSQWSTVLYEVIHLARVVHNRMGGNKFMLRLLWIAPIVLLAGCSRSDVATRAPGAVGSAQAAGASQADSRPLADHVGTAIPSGTALHVRVDESIDTRRNRSGDGFTATLAEPVDVDGRVLVPAGTAFAGHVTNAKTSGRMKGRAQLGLALDSFQLNGREYRVETTSVDRVSTSHKKRNSWLIGGGAGVGAAIGALAGGGKGALIGAGAGAGAGTAGAALTGKKDVAITAETPLRFTLRAAVEI